MQVTIGRRSDGWLLLELLAALAILGLLSASSFLTFQQLSRNLIQAHREQRAELLLQQARTYLQAFGPVSGSLTTALRAPTDYVVIAECKSAELLADPLFDRQICRITVNHRRVFRLTTALEILLWQKKNGL